MIAALRFAFNFTRRYATARIGIAVEARLRGMMYDAYLRFPRAFYDRHATGEVISRATNDIYPVRYFIGWGVVQAIQSVMMLVGAAIVLLSVNARLTLIAALAMPPIAVLTYVFAHKVFPISRVVQAKKGNLTEATDEAVIGIEMVQAFGREDDVRSRFGDRAEAVRAETMRQAGVEARFLPGLIFLPSLAIAAVLYFGGKDAIAGTLTIGQFTLFITLLLQLVWPLEALGWIINLGQRATAAASRSFAWLGSIKALPEPDDPAHLPDGPLTIKLENVHFSYGVGSEVLSGVDLEVAPGEIVAVCGATGAGKTSLLNLLPRFYDPTDGRVLVGGDRQPRSRARRAPGLRRPRHAEARPLLRPAPRQPALGPPGRRLGRRARRLRGRGRRGVRRRAAERLRHADRRARREPLRGPAPACRTRPSTRCPLARDRARRPDVGRRYRDRAAPRRDAAARGCRTDGADLRASASRRCSWPTGPSSSRTVASSRVGCRRI